MKTIEELSIKLEKLKKEEIKIISKILGLRKTEEGYRLKTRKTTEKHTNIEIYIRRANSMGTYTDYLL